MLHSICQQIWKTQQWPQDWKRSVFIPIQRKAMPKNVQTTTQLHIPHASKEMLKIFQASLQQCVNRELPDVQAGFRKGRGTRDQIANIHWIIEKAREFRKTSTSALLTMPKPLTVWMTTNCGRFLKRWEYQTHLTCLLRNLYAGQEATVSTGYGTMNWFKIGKGVCQGCTLSSCLFNFYAEYFMQNAWLDDS